MQRASLIIPTYNEAANIAPLCQEIFSSLDGSVDLEVIFVDDNSPDGTADEIKKHSGQHPIRLVERSSKQGLGSAVRAGFAASDRPIIGVMDADLSHDPRHITEFIHALNAADIAIGSRFTKGASVETWSTRRKLLSQHGVFLARLLTKTKDPLSGYFFLHRAVIEHVSLATTGYKILFEILLKENIKKIHEAPIQFRARQHSTSKLNTHEYWLFTKQLLAYAWYKLIKIQL